ncbi:hypothetical protein [Bartonella grahamii]|nr:hypothetical protein [Bartonella grahamii]
MCFYDAAVYDEVCVYDDIVIDNNALTCGCVGVCKSSHVYER